MNPLFSAPSTSETTLADGDFDDETMTANGPGEPTPATPAARPIDPPPPPTTPIDLQKTILVEEGLPGGAAEAPADAPTPTPAAAPAPTPAAAPTPATTRAQRRKRRRRRAMIRSLLPAWSVSLIVHVAIFTILGAATFNDVVAEKAVNINTALGGLDRVIEETPILADPADQRLDQVDDARPPAAADDDQLWADERPDSGGVIATVALPSTTPSLRGAIARAVDAERKLGPGVGLADLKRSPISQISRALSTDLYGGGNFGGDPAFTVGDIDAALSQLTHEILAHLADHKLTVLWLLDESTSMRDDHKALAKHFDRVSSELSRFIPADKKAAGALNHALFGFGEKLDVLLDRPTTDVEVVRHAISKLPIDDTGTENTMRAIREAVTAFSRTVNKDHKLLVVLATDESGDDGDEVEETLATLKKYNVPLYVLGRQSIFGYPFARHVYEDKITGDTYYPTIRRGPETADIEIFQWDGLYGRLDEKPAGFGPWELARLARDSGGIYFILPTEESLRARKNEKFFSIGQLKEYMPEYLGRSAYVQRRTESDLRRNLHQIVVDTAGADFRYRREFPIDAAAQVQAANEEGPKATQRLNALLDIQKQIESLKKHRDREPMRRWRAHYDLMLAQVVVFQIKAYEYRALMAEIAQRPRAPSAPPTANRAISFVVEHGSKGLAPSSETAKKYAEATLLLNNVIAEYPNTPWAELAKDALTRGFSVVLNEWAHNPNYQERERFVPKY